VAIYVEWAVRSGNPTDPTSGTSSTVTQGVPDDALDWTSRTREVEISMSCDIGRIGTASARIILDNSDGAFTPFGGGTYEDWDWVANPVWVYSKIGTNPASLTQQWPLFSGIVSDVQYTDDGFRSTVTLDVDDMWSVVSRAVLEQEVDTIGSPIRTSNFDVAYLSLLGATFDLPSFGAVSGGYVIDLLPATVIRPTPSGATKFEQLIEGLFEEGTVLSDMYQDIFASEHGIMFPLMFYARKSGAISYRYHHYGVPRNYLWTGTQDDPAPAEFTFVEGTPTGTELPFRSPTVGFNIDTIINAATCTVAGTGAVPQQATSAASITSYGPRSSELTSLRLGFDEDALELAEHLVARYSNVEYGVTGLTMTGNMITAKCDDAALDAVENIVTPNRIEFDGITFAGGAVYGPLYHPSFVEFTGAGGVDLSSRMAFFRASYRITPDDWEVAFSDGRPAEQVFGFIIGSTNYGVLGTNRVN
jgi:hypothetical protein